MKKAISDWINNNRKPLVFVAKMISSYVLLQFLYDYLLSPYTKIDQWLINSIIDAAEYGLESLGYTILSGNSIYQYHMGIEGTSGVVIGNPCDGLSLFILYTAFLVVFKGKWWFKLLFISLGIILIHFLNVIRVISLALIVKDYPETLDFHHSYTFTLFIYACIFLLWVLRIKVYQKKKV